MPSTYDKLVEFAQHMDDDLLRCRARSGRHTPPDPLDPDKTKYKRQRNGTYLEETTCESCGRVYTRIIASSGHLDDVKGFRLPKYNPEYLLPKEITRALDAPPVKEVHAVFRAEAIRRNRRRAAAAKRKAVPSPFKSVTSGG